MLTFAVILVVSGALILGALWGVYGKLPKPVEGFIVALAGGALLVSATMELIEPSIEAASVWAAMAAVLSGAALAGNILLAGVSDALLGLVRSFAAGAVVASLGTEVFPKGFKEDGYSIGVATALGVVLAILLSPLG